MADLYECIYCRKPCTITQEGNKNFVNCGHCGKKEATKLLVERLKAKGKIGSEPR